MFTLYAHQKKALDHLKHNRYFALFMEQGTGKTLPSLIWILDLLKSGRINNALVIAPKSALGAWERDIEMFNPLDADILRDAITFVNYEKVWRGADKSPYNRPYGCIILDEAHAIKNRGSKRSKFILKIATKCDYRYILTGTPIGNGQLENIWALYAFLDPRIERGNIFSNIFREYLETEHGKKYRGSYYEFLNEFCTLNRYYQPSAYRHVDRLQAIINAHSYRVKKSECLDLPEKLPDEIVRVELKEKAKYKALHKESALIDLDVLADNPLSRMLKLRQLCAGYIQTEDGIVPVKTEKPAVLAELLEGFDPDKKIVIFAEFKYSIAQICAKLEEMNVKYITLDGAQKNKNIWRDFQTDKTIRVIVCQYQTASAGIDLFASDTIIYYEPTLRSNVLEQSRDRIHRTGQTNKCSYIHLLTAGTIEEHIYRALSGYADFGEKLFTEYMNTYVKNHYK